MMLRACLASLLSAFVVTGPAFATDSGAAPTDSGTERVVFEARSADTPSRGSILPALYVSFGALQVTDGITTLASMERGATESNALMTGVAGNSAAVWAVKSGATVAAITVAERLWRKHRRTEAIVAMVAANGIMAIVAARNASVIQGLK